MAKGNFGIGIGLQSDFRSADALWANNRNRKANLAASQAQQQAREQEKANEYITKYLDTNNTGIQPLWANKAKEATTTYLNNFYSGLKKDPNYAKSAENITAFQELSKNLDNWKIASENLKKTAAFAYEHPEDIEVNQKVNDIVNGGKYEDWVAYRKEQGLNGDGFEVGFGALPIPNAKLHDQEVLKGVYEGVTPKLTPGRAGKYNTLMTTLNPNMDVYNENLFRLYNSDPLAAPYYKDKGGFEAYKKARPVPQPISKMTNSGLDSGWGSYNSSGEKDVVRNSMYALYPVSKNEFRFSKSGANTETSDKVFVHTSMIDESGKPLVDSEGKPITTITGNVEVAYKNNGNPIVGVRVEVPEIRQHGVLTQEKSSKLVFFPLDEAGKGQVWAATNAGKEGGILPFGLKMEGNVQTSKNTEQPKEAVSKVKENKVKPLTEEELKAFQRK